MPSQWAESNIVLPEGTAAPGPFRFAATPYLREIVDASADPRVRRIAVRKAAQVGYTVGVLLNILAARIALKPSRALVLFPREKSAIDFNDEKFEPMIDASPDLCARVNLTSRLAGNRQLFKKYPGGFVKFVASNSPGDVKSTSAPLVFVEEPDDCNQNVKGQGDSIKMAEERAKTYHDALIVIGGTPTVQGDSAIEREMERTDRRKFHVPCHHCGESHVLAWENVRWAKDEANPHPVFGKHHPETAHYACPACGGLWNDDERIANVRGGKWVATARFTGAAGFDDLNELYSSFPGSRMPRIVEKYLDANRAYSAGDSEKLITFWNSSLGRSFEYTSDVPPADELERRAESYEEFTVPADGLVLVMGVDVQGNRLAIQVWARGRDEESWLVYWGEEYGAPADKSDPVWEALDSYLDRDYQHASGKTLRVKAVTIDSSDGQTNDAVYDWVRRHQRGPCKVMAGKGRSGADAEIFVVPPPHSIDPGYTSKASKYGLKVFMIGTEKAKDLILGFTADGGRVKRCDRANDGTVRTGRGPGRMHWYEGVRPDFFEQLAESEVKIPKRGRRVWTLKPGRRNEALDCCVYAEHAARALRLHLYADSDWRREETLLIDAKSAPPLSLLGGFMPTAAVVST